MAQVVHYQQIIDIAPGPDIEVLPKALEKGAVDLLIFVSTSAVDYFIDAVKEPRLLQNTQIQVLAVGRSTAKRLAAWSDINVLTPELETSEGLLALAQLQASQVSGKKNRDR